MFKALLLLLLALIKVKIKGNSLCLDMAIIKPMTDVEPKTTSTIFFVIISYFAEDYIISL